MNRAIEQIGEEGIGVAGRPLHRLLSHRAAWSCVWFSALLLGAAPALAQTGAQGNPPVWRCGNGYSHQPCDTGQTVEVQDARTPEQQQQAVEQQYRLSTLLAEREKERAAQAAQERKAAIAQQRALQRELAAKNRAERREKLTAGRHAVRKHSKTGSRNTTGEPRAQAPQPVAVKP